MWRGGAICHLGERGRAKDTPAFSFAFRGKLDLSNDSLNRNTIDNMNCSFYLYSAFQGTERGLKGGTVQNQEDNVYQQSQIKAILKLNETEISTDKSKGGSKGYVQY